MTIATADISVAVERLKGAIDAQHTHVRAARKALDAARFSLVPRADLEDRIRQWVAATGAAARARYGSAVLHAFGDPTKAPRLSDQVDTHAWLGLRCASDPQAVVRDLLATVPDAYDAGAPLAARAALIAARETELRAAERARDEALQTAIDCGIDVPGVTEFQQRQRDQVAADAREAERRRREQVRATELAEAAMPRDTPPAGPRTVTGGSSGGVTVV